MQSLISLLLSLAYPLLVDCTILREALLAVKTDQEGFLCLKDAVFPVSLKETTNVIPSKLLIRSFHGEIKLIMKKLRKDREDLYNVGGAVFIGPSGTGKSWASQAVLIDELRDAKVSGKTVVYFDSMGKRAFVFSKTRNVEIESVSSPNVVGIPELMMRETVLIFDAARGSQDILSAFPCEMWIFASPNAGNFKQVAESNSLEFIVCPNWTLEELKLLEHGYGDRVGPDDVEKRFEKFGGLPRAVVAGSETVTETRRKNAKLVLQGIQLWSDVNAIDWPSLLIKGRFMTEKTAETPGEAYDKYREGNVMWDYSNTRAMELVHETYDKASEAEKRIFQSWLESESKAKALYWFEHRTRSLFTGRDVEIKVLAPNEGLNKDEEKNLMTVMSNVHRVLSWKMPKLKAVHDAAIIKGKNGYEMSELKKLTNPDVLYRLPQGFPIMDYYNPPNNCFSLGVGGHKINLDHAVSLCKDVIPANQQVNLVFVTPSINYVKVKHWMSFEIDPKKQKILGKLPADKVRILSRMVQFCMRFKKC